ncbi:hypothetical protein [Neorhizobium galegae]|uniref:hypothetical protein n=1 Tax=Neorhizobium galegae TaxID=399 RepID=UPI001F3261DC|nr:hypothetical protein [Neorhizobium galegae]UIK05033.1 hypothetical protein LZK81_20650 [Neorhizobium galegae]
MSALFFKVSLPHNIETYRRLKDDARRAGCLLSVKNVSRMRGVPIFLFFLDRKDGANPKSFSSLEKVEAEIGKPGVAA